jgi:hypothetical protein
MLHRSESCYEGTYEKGNMYVHDMVEFGAKLS